MGLDISHDAWHGPYSSFGRWRTEIAHAAGLPPLGLMEGFWSGEWLFELEKKRSEGKPHNMVPLWEKHLPIKWEALREDPLTVLLDHPDCDGSISPEDAARIADRLEEIMPNVPGEVGDSLGFWKGKTQEFIDGCRRAVAANEPLEFA